MATKTFAQEAKTITNRYKLRLGDKFDKGDPLALEAMNAELGELRERQEQARQLVFEEDRAFEQEAVQQFALGGKLNKKQKTTLSGLLERSLPKFQGGGGFDFGGPGTTETFTPHAGGGEGLFSSAPTADSVNLPADGEIPGFKSRVPWAGAAANMVGNFLANREIDLPEYKHEEYKPTQARANLVDYSRGREQTLRERDQANALITRGARGTGSQAGLMENIIAGATGTQREAGTAFNRSLEQEGNVNAQIRNEVAARNTQSELQAAQINMRGKLYETQLGREGTLINEQRRGNRIGAITDSISGFMGDKLAAGQYDQMVNMEMARNPNFNLKQADPTFWRRLAGITDPASINFRNTGDRASNV